jgi:hypothetical protein
MGKYDSIINLPHHQSLNHHPMSTLARAAQFAPFSALNGYEESLQDVEKITYQKREISNEDKLEINNKINFIIENKIKNEFFTIIFYAEDEKTKQGKCIEIYAKIKKINVDEKYLFCVDYGKILFDDIYDLQSGIFSQMH